MFMYMCVYRYINIVCCKVAFLSVLQSLFFIHPSVGFLLSVTWKTQSYSGQLGRNKVLSYAWLEINTSVKLLYNQWDLVKCALLYSLLPRCCDSICCILHVITFWLPVTIYGFIYIYTMISLLCISLNPNFAYNLWFITSICQSCYPVWITFSVVAPTHKKNANYQTIPNLA